MVRQCLVAGWLAFSDAREGPTLAGLEGAIYTPHDRYRRLVDGVIVVARLRRGRRFRR